ncbi:5-dehydro-2-deoxygluconokinase [Mesorhizobium sp. Root554]|uniref:5-dehydro-2-deoxygluconokinase n=1 Tax=Mesorhizobium sp. Root554 TaxID=1736557 RepID=UPI001FCDE77D|nr:5-dehydro-2-deoxygluconokinase [Mesorhizobium sp. Root554]
MAGNSAVTAAVDRIRGGRFLVLGRAGMDLYADPPGTLVEDATNFTPCLGGSSANIAVALTRHGLKSTLLTSVSDDAVGRFCINQLQRNNVSTDHIRRVGGPARNSLALAESRLKDARWVVYRKDAADLDMTAADVERLDFSSFDALVVAGLVLATEPSRSASLRAVELSRQAGVCVVFDIDYRAFAWASPQEASAVCAQVAALSDIVVGNEEEFEVLSGFDSNGFAAASRLAATTAEIVVYKMGDAGAITLHGSQQERTGIFPVEAVKPMGAGDAFLGSFLAALADGRSVRECVIRGSAAAAIVVTKVGCAPAMPTTGQLDDFLAANGAPTEFVAVA